MLGVWEVVDVEAVEGPTTVGRDSEVDVVDEVCVLDDAPDEGALDEVDDVAPDAEAALDGSVLVLALEPEMVDEDERVEMAEGAVMM